MTSEPEEAAEREYWIRWIKQTIATCKIYQKIIDDSRMEIDRLCDKYGIRGSEIE